MADNASTEEEPSIEEILDSIRQIISDEDDDGGTPAEAEAQAMVSEPQPEPVSEEESPVEEPDFEPEPQPIEEPDDVQDEVIDLTDRVDIQEDEVEIEPEIETVEGTPVSDAEPEFTPEPNPFDEGEPSMEIDMTDADEMFVDIPADKPIIDTDILTDKAASAAVYGFSDLVKKTAVENGGVTIEQMVRAELKPLLRNWLDQYLPSMIERLVQEELKRISKQVLED